MNTGVFDQSETFEMGVALFDSFAEGSAVPRSFNCRTDEFPDCLAKVLETWVDSINDRVEITYDGEIALVRLSSQDPSACEVWRYDFTAVDAGDAEKPDEVILMRI